MKLLFLSNYYPPHTLGGYELWCQEIAHELADRGHHVRVLTSRSPQMPGNHDGKSVPVHRLLNLEVNSNLVHSFIKLVRDRKRLELQNLEAVRKMVKEMQPDAALIWGMWNIPRSVPALVEQLLPGRVAYYLCDYWLTLPNSYIQQMHNPSLRQSNETLKKFVSAPFLYQLNREIPVPLKVEYPICVSHALRDLLVQANVQVETAAVIHGGIRFDDFGIEEKLDLSEESGTLKLIYVGRLTADKGVHTAVQAMGRVKSQKGLFVTLNIVGRGEADYEAGLKSLVKQEQLGDIVHFAGGVPREQIPAILKQHDALIFPSEWEEPFARTVLEGMAAGLAVIGTTTGGTGEILIEGETGLTFPAGDPVSLADQIVRLGRDPALALRLAKSGQSRVREYHTLSIMADKFERFLGGIFNPYNG